MEANLSPKSQRKTIHDSHFFINTHSTRQPPVAATIPTPATAGLFCRVLGKLVGIYQYLEVEGRWGGA